eukprot:2246078-Pleurochrysis_carterae.AAC.3
MLGHRGARGLIHVVAIRMLRNRLVIQSERRVQCAMLSMTWHAFIFPPLMKEAGHNFEMRLPHMQRTGPRRAARGQHGSPATPRRPGWQASLCLRWSPVLA